MKKFIAFTCCFLLGLSQAIAGINNPSGGGSATPGGTNGQIQYNNNGALGGLTPGASAQAAVAALQGAPAFYPTNYGAYFNTIYKNDLTTTASSPNVTSASYNFSSADVGKDITIYAGASVSITANTTMSSPNLTAVSSVTGIKVYDSIIGTNIPAGTYVQGIIPSTSTIIMSQQATATGSAAAITTVTVLNTTIASVTAPTAVLATNATTTVSGKARGYFGTDDTTAMQAAISAATTAGGGVIQLPAGEAMITLPLVWASNISINGLGPNTSILKWASASGMSSSAPALIYGGSGSLGAPYNNMTFSNFQIDMDAATEASITYFASCATIPYTHNWVVINTYMHGSPASCIRNDYEQNMLVYGNTFAHTGRLSNGSGTGGNAIGATYAENAAYPTSSIIANNVFYDPGVTGILYQAGGTTNTKSDYLVATSNLIYYDSYTTNSNNNISGIDEAGGYMPVISGNTVISTAPPSGTFNYGIGNGNSDSGQSTGNMPSIGGIIENNTVNGMMYGILLGDDGSSDYKIAGNTVLYTNGECIRISPATVGFTNIDISGNTGAHCGGSGLRVATNGANGSTLLNNISIRNNKFYDNGSVQSSPNKSGIAFLSNTAGTIFNNINIQGNEIYDDGSAIQLYGISVAANTTVNNITSQGNTIRGNVTGSYLVTGTVSGYAENNMDGTPTIAAGTGAGASPTVSINGTNQLGVITVTTGTSPTASATVATITYPTGGLLLAPKGCSITPQNASASLAAAMIYTTAPTTTAWTIADGGTALTASTAYSWSYSCF